MIARTLAMTLAVATLAWLAANFALAASSFDGTVEKAGAGKISIKDKAGTVQEFTVDAAAKIMLDGKEVKLDQIGMGSMATVVTEVKNNQTLAVMITARSKLSPPGDS